MRTEIQRHQIVECINAFIGEYKPVMRCIKGIGKKGGRIAIDGKLHSSKSLVVKLFSFAEKNGFVSENYIGYSKDLVLQLRSSCPIENSHQISA